MPGLLEHYRQQRAAWLAQADELARMREEVRQAAEREALEIVTSARRDVRRIIIEARRELLVLTAQLHAAVEATDAPGLPLPSVGGLLTEPDRLGHEAGWSGSYDISRAVVLEARKGVRSVLDEARAEIEALSAEAPAVVAAATGGRSIAAPIPAAPEWHDAPFPEKAAPAAEAFEPPLSAGDDPGREGPVHELSLDSALSVLDFQTRDLPIPTLARLLGTDDETTRDTPADEAPLGPRAGFEPLSFDSPRLSELRTLLRDTSDPFWSAPAADRGPVLSPEVEPSPAAAVAFDAAPRSDFFASLDARADELGVEPEPDTVEPEETLGTPRSTPPSRLFGDEGDTLPPARSARTFIGLFAATGALAVVATLWWALTREGPEPLSAAAPVVVEGENEIANSVPANPPGTMALTIEARRPSWIRAQIDGKDEEGRFYQAGETRHIEGAHAVSIRAGDAGAVFVGVDGAAAQPLGPEGQDGTKQFTAQALLATPAVATTAGAPTGAAPAVAGAPNVLAAAPLPGRRPDAHTTPPANAPATTAAPAPNNIPVAGEGVPGARPDLVQAGQQWLDAYQRRDRDAMATTSTDNVTISDERSVNERFPAWQSSVRRDLDQVELELTGDTALLTSRMTERADGAQGGEHVSRVSQIWLRRNGRWRLADVRIIGEARLNQIIR